MISLKEIKQSIRLYRKSLMWTNWIGIIRKSRKVRKRYYSKSFAGVKSGERKVIIWLCDGRVNQGGFADRLRGLISTYEVAKDLGYDFKVVYNTPFELSDLLLPNIVNWQIEQSDISYNSDEVGVYNINNLLSYQSVEQQYRVLRQIMDKPYKQIHIYSNSPMSFYRGRYSELYNELFKFNPKFEVDLHHHLDILGDDYISISTRFGTTMGDFVDSYGTTLSESDQQDQLVRCKEQIEKIHLDNAQSKIFITSDSQKYINYMRNELDYTYSFSGEREHIDVSNSRDFELHKLTFLDYFLISKAKRVIQLKSDVMYGGAFSRSASFINSAPYEIIEF